MTKYTLVWFDVNTAMAAEAGVMKAGDPFTGEAMIGYARSILVGAGWRAEGAVELLIDGVWQCSFDRGGKRFVLAGELQDAADENGGAQEWREGVISMGPEGRRSLFEVLLGRNKPDPAADAEAQKAALAILGRAPGIRNLRVEATT